MQERISYARSLIAQTDLVLATDSATPIFMRHFDSVPAAQAAVKGLRERGFFVCISTFPAVPLNKPSIRFTMSRHNGFDDIRALVDALVDVTSSLGQRPSGASKSSDIIQLLPQSTDASAAGA